jgi:hypothetical protein
LSAICGLYFKNTQIVDDQAQIIITADAIIDNREELCDLLSIDDGNITDSLLILKAYQKLYSFTQVPMEGYRDWLPPGKLADEREYIEANCRVTGY